MPALQAFERDAIRLLAGNVLGPELLDALTRLPHATRYEYTGSGYYLTLSHLQLPEAPATLSRPIVVGDTGDIHCGFVVFLGDRELTLECHTWGGVAVPEDMRQRDVRVAVSDNVIFFDAT